MVADNYYLGDSKVQNVHTNNIVDIESNKNIVHTNVD